MNLSFRYLFGLDQKLRTYLRFLIETSTVIIVYIFWLASVGGFREFGAGIHLANLMVWIFLYYILGLHRDRIRFSSLSSYYPVVKLSLILSAILTIEYFGYTGKLDIFSFFFVLLATLNFLVGLRVVARQIIRRDLLKTKENVLVYGTSDIAIDLANAMAFGKKYSVVGFISDSSQNAGSLAGLPVIRFEETGSYAASHNCRLIVLASQTASPARQTEILLKLDTLGLSVSYAPTMDRAFDYEVQLNAVKPEDVLGRVSEIKFDEAIYAEARQKTILVTGAGGSIGSEICRQILRYQPEKLIVLESSEFALYRLEQELSKIVGEYGSHLAIVYKLGSVTDEVILESIFKQYSVHVIYHAAAYKHVPIVEENIVAGIKNNVFGTKLVADFARRFGAAKFVLVSTDKAVRPTNVMGASKRIAELVIQDLSKSSKTIFTMVRFGNVLGSSGSVIPKFKSQINAGGPITVTHEEITRYFMSIPEAAHLVLSAGTFAFGGEVFLLDMGDPVKIVELAKSMVRQHGLQPIFLSDIEQRQKRTNEIVIEFSGLRPGEKLYEELLVDGAVKKTSNPKILMSEDGVIESLDLSKTLRLLEKNLEENRMDAILEQLEELPISYQPSTREAFKKTYDGPNNKVNFSVSETAVEQNTNFSFNIKHKEPSLFQRLVISKIGLALMHRYFLLARGMTLGVRVLVKNQNGEILLVNHTYVPGWHLPGGGIDHGEDAEAAAKREVFEECGIDALSDMQLLNFVCNSDVSKRDHVAYFKAQSSQSPTVVSTLEIKEAVFFPIDGLPPDIEPSVSKVLSWDKSGESIT